MSIPWTNKTKRGKKPKKNRKDAIGTMVVTKQKVFSDKYSRIDKVKGTILPVNFPELVTCPRTHTLHDWLIVNAVEFLDRTEILFSSCSLFCTDHTCPLFNAGPNYHYLWEDADIPQPIQLSAPAYFNAVKRFAKRNMSNARLFPVESGTQLSADAMDVLKIVYRRLYRILAHMYVCHIKTIQNAGMEIVLNTMLGHYTTFGMQYDMIGVADMKMLGPVFTVLGMEIEGIGEE